MQPQWLHVNPYNTELDFHTLETYHVATCLKELL